MTLRNGLDARTLMAYSGHRNLSTVQRYAHLVGSQDRMKEEAKRFPAIYIHGISTKPMDLSTKNEQGPVTP